MQGPPARVDCGVFAPGSCRKVCRPSDHVNDERAICWYEPREPLRHWREGYSCRGSVVSYSAVTAMSGPTSVISGAAISASVVCAVVISVMIPAVEGKKAKSADKAGPVIGVRIRIVDSVPNAARKGVSVLIVIYQRRRQLHDIATRGHALREAEFIRFFGLCRGGDFAGCGGGTRAGRRRSSASCRSCSSA
jgi:hypothetical protein